MADMSTKELQLRACIQSIQTANEYMLSKKPKEEVIDLVKGHLLGWVEVLSTLIGDRDAWAFVNNESDYLIRRDFAKKHKTFKAKRRKV